MQQLKIKGSTCAHCGKTFDATRKTAKYCSASCKVFASQTRTGRREIVNTPANVQGINVDELLEIYKRLESECTDYQKELEALGYQTTARLILEKKIFGVKRQLFHVVNDLFQNGYSGEVVKDYKKMIPVYPFWYDKAFPVNLLGEPIYTFIAYIYHGNRRGNTNLLLRFAEALIVEYDFKVVFFTESLKKLNSGFVDGDDYCDVNLDLTKITVKTVKNRVDIETFLSQNDKKFDFICMDCENVNVDADFLESLQQKHLYLSIICTTVKPVQSIVENANHSLNLNGAERYYHFENVHPNLDYGLDHHTYWGEIPKR
jgi:hypothetical protein